MKQISYRKLILAGIFLAALMFSLDLSMVRSASPGSKNASSADRLLTAHSHDYPQPTAIALVEPQESVTTERVEYVTIDGQKIFGYYAYPAGANDAAQPLPGIIAIHEWWGLNANIEAMARRLAGEGYQVLAVDLYGGKTGATPERAAQLALEAIGNPLSAEANITKAYKFLAAEKRSPKVAAVGWCFGGSWSLETALLFPQELDAAVIYYGGQIATATPEELKTLEMPILGIFGAEDETIPMAKVEKLASTLKELDKQADIQIYDNVGHAFANPSGKNYVAEAAEKAWSETTDFLQEHLQSEKS